MTERDTEQMSDPIPAVDQVRWGGIDHAARLAGYLGLLPFLGALLLTVLGDPATIDFGSRLAIAWGAVILSFIAAVHWGLALAGRWPWTFSVIGVSTAPAVLGAAAVLVGGERGIALLIVGFGIFWLIEHRRLAADLPADYLALRRVLSICVCVLLALTAFAASGDLA
jgi:hypothetical protein